MELKKKYLNIIYMTLFLKKKLNKNDYETLWFDSESNISIIKPLSIENYVPISNIVITENTDLENFYALFIKNDEKNVSKPLKYYKIFGNDTMSVWRVIPPTHHISFGDIIKTGNEEPKDVYCVNEDHVREYNYYNVKLYQNNNFTIWRMNTYNSFIVNLSKYPSNLIKYEPNII